MQDRTTPGRDDASRSDDSRADAILGAWRDARDRGEAPDREALLAAHPDIRGALEARLDAMDVLEAVLAHPRTAVARLRSVLDDRRRRPRRARSRLRRILSRRRARGDRLA